MERLTKRMCGGFGVMPGCELNTAIGAKAVVDRLAAYEDTGLGPEDIDTLRKREQGLAELLVQVSCGCAVPYTRLAELAQAEKDGRLVVLPCKVGDNVLVDVRTLPYNYLHPADGCRDYAKCEIVSIVATKKEAYMKLRALYPSRDSRREYLRYGVTAIGKTVFLTREEAEAALEKREEEDSEAVR